MPSVNEEIHSALLGVSLFSELDANTLSALAQIAYIRHVPQGGVVFRQGDPGEELLVLLRGSIQARARGARGDEVTLGVMGPGEFFGEMALLDGFPRSATVLTLQDSDLVVVDRETFSTLLRQHPQISISMLRSMARRFRRANETLADIATLDVYHRVAKRLLYLASAHGSPAERGIRITVPVTAQVLSGLVAAPPEAVERVLAQLGSEGLMRRDEDHIIVLDADRLARLKFPAE